MSLLMIPVALDSIGEKVVAEISLEKSRGPFRCLECNREVLLHQGDIRTPYFRHKPSADANGKVVICNSQSLEHKAAIHLLTSYLFRYHIFRTCCNCNRTQLCFSDPSAGEEMFARSEVSLLNNLYRADVGIFTGNPDPDVSMVIEVYHTHKIGSDKRARLLQAGYEVFEVNALDVINAYQKNTFEILDLVSDWTCPLCTVAMKQCEKFSILCSHCRQNRLVLDAYPPGMRISTVDILTRHAYGTLPNALCDACNRRPCYGCGKWQSKTGMKAVEAPPFTAKFPMMFICNHCAIACRTCGENVTVSKVGHCAQCQRAAAQLYREHLGKWKHVTWPYNSDPPSLAQMRSDLFLQPRDNRN